MGMVSETTRSQDIREDERSTGVMLILILVGIRLTMRIFRDQGGDGYPSTRLKKRLEIAFSLAVKRIEWVEKKLASGLGRRIKRKQGSRAKTSDLLLGAIEFGVS